MTLSRSPGISHVPASHSASCLRRAFFNWKQKRRILTSWILASFCTASVLSAQPPALPQASVSSIVAPTDAAVVARVSVDPLDIDKLTIADVVVSVARAFPLIEQARLQAGVTAGESMTAYGAFDQKLYGYSLAEPTGYYRNYRQGIGVARQLWWGGYLAAGYRIGRGDFAPWYKERETNKGGEYSIGLVQPLLQGRAIDPSRVAVFQANLRQQAVGPEVDRSVLINAREAADVYWDWVAVGGVLEAQRELLDLADHRTKQLEDLVQAGKNKAVDLIFNEQLVAERKLKVIETQRKFRDVGFKLSLYLRDETGKPMVPDDAWLPEQFPRIDQLPPGDFSADVNLAFSQRPELKMLNLEVQSLNWDLRLANNQLLPHLDVVSEASQDTGTAATYLNDKGRFELELGLQGEVPIQRRKARGKIMTTQSKMAQLQQKIKYQQDKIAVELQTARNTLDLAAESVIQAEAGLRSAITSLDRYNFAFSQGQVDLVYLNLLETKSTESEIKLLETQRQWFSALAGMQAALGLDPIEQALQVSSLPPSTAPSPRHLPPPAAAEAAPAAPVVPAAER